MGKVIVAEGSDSIRSRLAELEAAYGTGGNGRLDHLESQTQGWVNVASFGAAGDGTTDDLPAFNAAVAAVRAAGGGTIYVPRPPVAYRFTDTWVVGSAPWADVADLYVRQPPDPHPGDLFNDRTYITPSYNATNYALAVQEPLINVVGEPGTFIWGDFTSSTRKAIVYYTAIGQIHRNEYTPGMARFQGINIAGKEAFTSAGRVAMAYENPVGSRAALAAGNHQVGLAYLYSPLDVRDCAFQELDVGLLTWSPYWGSGHNLKSYHCNTGFSILSANASTWENLASFYALDWGLIISGDCVTLTQYNTENCYRDIWIPYADYFRWDGGYLENRWAGDTEYGCWAGDEVNTGDTSQVLRSSIDHVKFNRQGDKGWRFYATRLLMRNSRIVDDEAMVLDTNTFLWFENMDAPTYAAGSRTDRAVNLGNALGPNGPTELYVNGIVTASGNLNGNYVRATNAFIPQASGTSAAIEGRVGAVATAVKIGNLSGLLTNDGAKIAAFYSDALTTEVASVNALGGITPGAPTAAWTAAAIYMGSGAPNNANGGNGSIYIRTDTPGTVNQRIYVKASGAWTGIL